MSLAQMKDTLAVFVFFSIRRNMNIYIRTVYVYIIILYYMYMWIKNHFPSM